MTSKLKYVGYALLLIVAILVAAFIYRMYFKFSKAKIKSYVQNMAGGTADPATAMKILMEGSEYILKSQDLSKQVEIMAEQSGKEKEEILVMAAFAQCVANGYIEKEENTALGVTIPGDQA